MLLMPYRECFRGHTAAFFALLFRLPVYVWLVSHCTCLPFRFPFCRFDVILYLQDLKLHPWDLAVSSHILGLNDTAKKSKKRRRQEKERKTEEGEEEEEEEFEVGDGDGKEEETEEMKNGRFATECPHFHIYACALMCFIC